MGTWTHPFAVLHLSCQLTINSTTTPHQWPLNSEVRLKIQGGHYTPMSMICSRHTHTYTHTEQSNLQPNTNSVGGKIFQVLLPNQQFNSPDKEMSKVKGHQGHPPKKKKASAADSASCSLCHFWTNNQAHYTHQNGNMHHIDM